MRENYYYHFEHFDPKTGVLPEPFGLIFVDITAKARRILRDFSSDEISQSTLIINDLIRDSGFIDPFYEDIKNDPIPTPYMGGILNIVPSTNDVKAIYQNINNIPLDEYLTVANFNWHHVFASIALFYSELILELLNGQATYKEGSIFPKLSDETLNDYIKDFVVEATQAITFAEICESKKLLDGKNLSENSRKAAKKKHNKSNNLKEIVIELFRENFMQFSNREAAKRILFELVNKSQITIDDTTNRIWFDGDVILQTDDPEQRLAIWIGKFRNKELN